MNKERNQIKYPRGLTLSLTNLCNANCAFCYRRDAGLTPSFFPFKRFRELIDEVGPHLKALSLSGIGEPMLHPEFAEFVRYARLHYSMEALSLVVTTNGSRLSAEMNQLLVDQRVTEVWASLNAATPQTHSKVMPGLKFSQVMEGTRDLIRRRTSSGQRRPEVRLSFVVSKSNYTEAEPFIDLAFELGVDRVTIAGVDKCLNPGVYESQHVPAQLFAPVYERIERLCEKDRRVSIVPRWAMWPSEFAVPGKKQARTIRCSNADGDLGIFFTNGESTFCCFMAAVIERRDVCLGNVLQQTVADVWNGARASAIRASLEDASTALDLCRQCTNFWGKEWVPRRSPLERVRRGLRRRLWRDADDRT